MTRCLARVLKIESDCLDEKEKEHGYYLKSGGWSVFVDPKTAKNNKHMVFIEKDSWVPISFVRHLDYETMYYYGVHNGVNGVLVSYHKFQPGLLLGMEHCNLSISDHPAGSDVTGVLGITEWHSNEHLFDLDTTPNHAKLPYDLDFLRIEHFENAVLPAPNLITTWEVSELVDGWSCVVVKNDRTGFEVFNKTHRVEEINDNIFYTFGLDISRRMKCANQVGYAIYGEIVGPGIRHNYYKLKSYMFLVCDICKIGKNKTKGLFLSPKDCRRMAEHLGLDCVPFISSIRALDVNPSMLDLNGKTQIADNFSSVQSEKKNSINENKTFSPFLAFVPSHFETKDMPLSQGLVVKCNQDRFLFKNVNISFNNMPESSYGCDIKF